MPQLPMSDLSDEEEYQARNAWATMDRVKERLKKKGITLAENPPPFSMPEVTTTLVDTDNHQYLKTNAQYLAWLNFVLPYLALARGVILEAQNEKTNIAALYRRSARAKSTATGSKKPPEGELEDAITLDPRYVELTQIEQEMIQEKYLLEAKVEELERTLRVISRHLEAKKIDMEENKVGAGLPRRHPYTFGR